MAARRMGRRMPLREARRMSLREARRMPLGEGRRVMARREVTHVRVASDRGVFMISVAAELAEMHPQTLRVYEARGLIEPKRSPKGTRLYSQEDVERLRHIQSMTAQLGLNLAGVERVLDLEEKIEALQRPHRRARGGLGARAGRAGREAGGGAAELPRGAGALRRRSRLRAGARGRCALAVPLPRGGARRESPIFLP